MLPRARVAATILSVLLLFLSIATATNPVAPAMTMDPCHDDGPLETRPADCPHVQWQIIEFRLEQNESIRLDAKVIAESAAHWGFYWSRWSTDDTFRITTDHGTPRTTHTSLAAAGQNHSVGFDAPQADMGVTTGLRYRETQFLLQEDEDPTRYVWLIGAGSDRPFELDIGLTQQPQNLTIENGTRGQFRHLSAFDEGVIVQTGGVRAPGASLSSIALAANASQDIELTDQTHGAFGLTGHELDYQVEHQDILRANGTLRNGRVDIQLFDLQPGPWTFTVNQMVGGATPQALTTPGSGMLLLLETPRTIDYPDDRQNLVIPQIHPHETLINP